MFCTQCGVSLEDSALYCSQCGAATERAPRPASRRLMRSRYDRKIAGVCGGLAEYLQADPTLIRILWVILIFFPPGGALVAYLVAWIVMPKEPERLPAVHAEPVSA